LIARDIELKLTTLRWGALDVWVQKHSDSVPILLKTLVKFNKSKPHKNIKKIKLNKHLRIIVF
jgi:hypothetical protein